MDAPESSGNRIGRSIWTVWGYLSGAVTRFLRPEVTDEGNQTVRSRADDVDLKSTVSKISEEKSNNRENEEKSYNQNDKTTAEVKCSLPEVKVQVASVQWENTDVVKDDNNDEIRVDTARKQTYHCAIWSAETAHEGSVSGDSESQSCKSGARAEKEAISSDEGQAEGVHANSEKTEAAQKLDETGQIEQKHGNDKEYDQTYADEKCSKKREDPVNTDLMVQSELYGQDVEMKHGETECIGNLIDEMEKIFVGLKDREKPEIDEDQGPKLQVQADAFVLEVQDLLPEVEHSTEETDGILKPEMLKVMGKYSNEIAEFSNSGVEEMIPGTRGATESKEDMTKSELLESAETLQRVSKEISENNASNNETELKITSELDEFFETINTPEDTLQLDSKPDTPENISETGTGSPVAVIKNDDMFSDLIVCEFPGESRNGPETVLGCFEEVKTNLHDPQTLAEEQTEKETFVPRSVEHPEISKAVEEAVEIEQDIETPVESLGAIESQTIQEIDETKLNVELRTELIVETSETKISSDDKEAEAFEAQSQSSNNRNVPLQTHELLEFTERECKSSQEAMDTFSESLENSSVSEINETAEMEHVAEDQTDVKPLLTRTLSPAEFPEEIGEGEGESEQCNEVQDTLDTDVGKTALEYVEEITNQVLKEMIEMEMNMVQETETVVGLSTEELGDAEYQGTEECVSVGAFVLEEEWKLLGETMGSTTEMEVETASREVAKPNEQHISSPEYETTAAGGGHEQQTYLCAGIDHGMSISCDTESEGYKAYTHFENEAVSSDEGQAERVHASSECKESETALELDETGQIEPKDGNDEESDQNHEDEKCTRKSRDADKADVIVPSELCGQDVEEEMVINMMDCGETACIGSFRHTGNHLIDEKEENIVDRNDHENYEDQVPELKVQTDAFVLEEGRTLLSEMMDSKIDLTVENASSDVVKQNEQQSSPDCETTEADGRHEQIQKVIAGETHLSRHEDLTEISRPGMKRGFDRVSKDLPVMRREGKFDLDLQAFQDTSLDFTIQKSRIAVKNPLVRPPKDARKLLYKISAEPLLTPPPSCAQKVEVSVPIGMIGFKLPGLGTGMPVLRKTEFGKKTRGGGEAEHTLHPQQKAVAVTEDSVKQEQASAKPKWTPPKHPGLGGPLMMAELKSKLKKPVKE